MARAGKYRWSATIERVAVPGDSQYLSPDPNSGAARTAWVSIAGYEPGSPPVAVKFWGERQDMLPSRSESVQQGLVIGRRQTRWRMRWYDGLDSSMRVTIHAESDEVFNIIGGPGELGGPKNEIELLLERLSS